MPARSCYPSTSLHQSAADTAFLADEVHRADSVAGGPNQYQNLNDKKIN